MARRLMTIEQVLAILRETPERLSVLAGGLDEPRLRAAPEPGEWSVTEIVAHLRSCADVWGRAIETIATTSHATIRAVSPTTWVRSTDYRDLACAASLQAFRRQREQLLDLLEQLPEQDWSRSATVLGGGRPLEITVHSYAARLARHERTHWKQVAKTVRALME